MMMKLVILCFVAAEAALKKPLTKTSLKVRGGGLWQDYQKALESKPILTKATTSLVGFGVSDVGFSLAP